MAEAHAKQHDYHLVNPSPWPIVGAVGALALAVGAIMFFISKKAGTPQLWYVLPGLLLVIFTMFAWWRDVIKEANEGYDTPVVQLHLRYGMILFIASEVMFFVAWFWAYFDAALFPTRPSPCPHASARRPMAADPERGDRCGGARQLQAHLRSVGSAVRQHADPAHLRHDGDLGAPCAAPQRPQRDSCWGLSAPSCSASCSRHAKPTSTCMLASASPATSTVRPSSWRPASTASM